MASCIISCISIMYHALLACPIIMYQHRVIVKAFQHSPLISHSPPSKNFYSCPVPLFPLFPPPFSVHSENKNKHALYSPYSFATTPSLFPTLNRRHRLPHKLSQSSHKRLVTFRLLILKRWSLVFDVGTLLRGLLGAFHPCRMRGLCGRRIEGLLLRNRLGRLLRGGGSLGRWMLFGRGL